MDESRVAPFLFGLAPTDVTGPLTQFQATRFDKDDVKKLVAGVNSALEEPLPQADLDRYFDRDWPHFEKAIRAIPADEEPPQPDRGAEDMLTELLERTRDIQRQLAPRRSQPDLPWPEDRLIAGARRAAKARSTTVRINPQVDENGLMIPITEADVAQALSAAAGESVRVETPMREPMVTPGTHVIIGSLASGALVPFLVDVGVPEEGQS